MSCAVVMYYIRVALCCVREGLHVIYLPPSERSKTCILSFHECKVRESYVKVHATKKCTSIINSTVLKQPTKPLIKHIISRITSITATTYDDE